MTNKQKTSKPQPSQKTKTTGKSLKKTPKKTTKKPTKRSTDTDLPFALPQITAAQKNRAAKLAEALEEAFPDAHCELDYTTPHELLVATILSAQATDVSVNKATPALFAAFPTPADYASATPQDIEPYIRTIGLYRNKAKSIHSTMSDICTKHAGQVPQTMHELLELKGVARKTANVVLGNAFNINVGFVVDTHIQRLARRYALAEENDSVQTIERKLMAAFPREHWCKLSHQLIFQGRRACKARPTGNKCPNNKICKTYGKNCEFKP